MKKQDLYFGVCLGIVFLSRFFYRGNVFDFYMASVSSHALLMSFLKVRPSGDPR